MENPLRYFAELKDPRVERTRRHLLPDIVLIAIAAILSGAGGWDEIERYGKAKKSWLKSFLQLPHGIPSHDTFNRVFQALDPAELEKSFLDWVRSLTRLTAGEVVAIDGKSLRGTAQAEGTPIVHMVSAWASANNLVLGQRKTDAKSNEIYGHSATAGGLGVERNGGHHRCHRLPEGHRTADRHPAGCRYPGGKGKPAVPVGRHQGFVPDARCR